MAVIEPMGIRFFGVEIRERQLRAIARATEEAIHDVRWDAQMASNEVERLSKAILRFGQLMTENEEYVSSSDAQALQRLFRASGLAEYGRFFEAVLRNISKRKLIVEMLSSFSTVSIERGSLSIIFRNVEKRTEELKVSIRKIWKEVEKKSENIKNSFKQFAQWVMTRAKRTILHIGVYGAALAIVLFSVWHCFTFNVATNLGSLASNIVANLKAAFPILSLALFIFCMFFDLATSKGIIEEAWKAIQQFLA